MTKPFYFWQTVLKRPIDNPGFYGEGLMIFKSINNNLFSRKLALYEKRNIFGILL